MKCIYDPKSDPLLKRMCIVHNILIVFFFWRFHNFVSIVSHDKFPLWGILLNDDFVIIK